MNFRGRHAGGDELDINLVPLIDVLLVMLIFLAASTTFARYTQLEIALPQAAADQEMPAALEIAVSQDGRYALNGVLVETAGPAGAQALAQALGQAAAGLTQPVLVIHADAQATHQAVVNVMEAARLAGIARVNFAARSAP
ncbi:ExbD/TolR family protein [Bordetella sp. 2513F-2]